jgi:hypothetical protein
MSEDVTLDIPPDPVLDTIFVRNYVQTGDALDSFKRAGYMSYGFDQRDVVGCLLNRVDIQSAIKAAFENPGNLVEITKDSIVSDLEIIHRSAMTAKDFTPAIAAKKLQAQLMGVLQENVSITHHMDVKRMTDEELIRLIELKSKSRANKMIDITPVGIGKIGGKKD